MEQQEGYFKHNQTGVPSHFEARAFDGKRVRKAIQRRTIDYNAVFLRYCEVKKKRKGTEKEKEC